MSEELNVTAEVQQDENDLRRIRVEKLEALQADGKG